MPSSKVLASFTLLSLLAIASADRQMAEWTARYDHISRVIVAKDFESFKKMMSPKYTCTDLDGVRKNRKQATEGFAGLFQMKTINGKEVVHQVSRKGNLATVSFSAKWTFVDKGGKTTKMNEAGVDTWEKVGAKCLLRRTVAKKP